MLIPSYGLGDTALCDDEAIIRLREETDSALGTRRLHRQAELSDPNRSAGPRLSWNEVIFRLRKANPSLLFKDGSAGNIAVYVPLNRQELAERDVDEVDYAKPEWHRDHRYVAGFSKDWLPEYSHVEVNDRNLPVREIRGWRTVLLSLLKAKAITLPNVNRYFGAPTGSRAWSWNTQLHELQEHN